MELLPYIQIFPCPSTKQIQTLQSKKERASCSGGEDNRISPPSWLSRQKPDLLLQKSTINQVINDIKLINVYYYYRVWAVLVNMRHTSCVLI